jgi:hypothetical protein
MGYSIGWIAVQGKGPDEVLAAAGLRDTGEPDPNFEEEYSGGLLSTGWYLVISNGAEYFTSSERMAKLSSGCRLVGCHVEEHVMDSGAFGYDDGREIWSVVHQAHHGLMDLVVKGSPPTEFSAIRKRMTERQVTEGGADADVDYIFEIPTELAAAICGFKHDAGDDLPLNKLTSVDGPKRKGLLGGLFGRS